MRTLPHATCRKIAGFGAQGLADVAWSYAALEYRSNKLNEAFMGSAVERIESRESDRQELTK